MLRFDIQSFGTKICQHFYFQTQLTNIPTRLVSCGEILLRTDVMTFPSPDWPYRFLRATCVWIFLCFIPYSALHTTDIVHEFNLFNLASSSNIKSSSVSTDHYICCYSTWTHILNRAILLLLKEINKVLLNIELASTLGLDHEPLLWVVSGLRLTVWATVRTNI
jgi:hypothetical protein